MNSGTEPTILVVGAAGDAGGLVAAALAERGVSPRGLVQSQERIVDAESNGANQVIVADLRDPAQVASALVGIERVFYLAPAFIEDEARIGCDLVAAAAEAGVTRIVFSSVVHPVLGDLINHAAKAPVEQAILNSGLEYTFLHPAVFFQMLSDSWPDIIETGVLAEPWSNQTRISRVDYRDVAELAARALIEDTYLNGTFELAADSGLNRYDLAALITSVTGRSVRAERLDPDDVRAIEPLRVMFEHYDKHDLLANPLTLRAALGRQPRSLRDYVTELAR